MSVRRKNIVFSCDRYASSTCLWKFISRFWGTFYISEFIMFVIIQLFSVTLYLRSTYGCFLVIGQSSVYVCYLHAQRYKYNLVTSSLKIMAEICAWYFCSIYMKKKKNNDNATSCKCYCFSSNPHWKDKFNIQKQRFMSVLSWPNTKVHTVLSGFRNSDCFGFLHYVTVAFKSWNMILVSPHIPRSEICQILPFSQKRVT